MPSLRKNLQRHTLNSSTNCEARKSKTVSRNRLRKVSTGRIIPLKTAQGPVPYLSSLLNLFSLEKVKAPIISQSKYMLHNVQSCSRNVKDFVSSFVSQLSSGTKNTLKNTMKVLLPSPSKRKLEKRRSEIFKTFVLKDSCDGNNSRSVVAQLWERSKWCKIQNERRKYCLIRSIIRKSLFVMTDLDIYLLKRLLKKYAYKFQFLNLNTISRTRQTLIVCLSKAMSKNKSVVQAMLQVLQQWYLIQPLVIQLCRYAGVYTKKLDARLTDLDGLYELLKNYQSDTRKTSIENPGNKK